MALRTGGFTVARGAVVGFIHKQGDGYAVPLHDELGIAVTPQAVLVGDTGGVENPADLVGRVAIDTGRDDVWLFLPEPSLDDLAVNLLDLPVTLGAGLGDVVVVNARVRVGVRKNVVRGMARGTNRGDGQPLLEQTLPVNAHRVVLQDSGLGNVAVERDR